MNIAFHTLGCKVNQYETGLIKEHFSLKGYNIVNDDDIADVYIINTCTVTGTADKKIGKLIRRFKRLSPLSLVAVTGCFPQAFPKEAESLMEADIIVGTKDRLKLIELIENHTQRYFYVSPHKKEDAFEDMAVNEFTDKTRAFVKIQDGCDRYCAYCIIPYARGHVRSKKISDVIKEVTKLSEHGHKEIVLVGINLSMYGRDIGTTLTEMVEKLCLIPTVIRIRLGSTEPVLVTKEDFLKMSTLSKVCPHFHIALQSGCDETLKRMHRPYTTKEYLDIINTVRQHFTLPAITTDVIVGFPGETEEEFKITCDYIKALAPSDVHIFPYSKRQGTLAFSMDNHIPEDIKKQRVKILSNIVDTLKDDFLKAQIGTMCEVLFENTTNYLGRMGHTPNYTSVYVNHPNAVIREIKQVRITDMVDGMLVGEIMQYH